MTSLASSIHPALLELAWARRNDREPELLAPAGGVGIEVERGGKPVVLLFDSARDLLKFYMAGARANSAHRTRRSEAGCSGWRAGSTS